MWFGLRATVEVEITFLTVEMYRSENDFYCGPSYIARYDERIRFNDQNNDRCEADREELDVQNVVFWIVTQQGT